MLLKIIKYPYIQIKNYFFKNINRLILVKKNVIFDKKLKIEGVISINNKGSIAIGNNFKANSGITKNPIGGDTILRLITSNTGSIVIGNYVGISNTTIYSANTIIIEDYVLIGGGCKIYDTDFHSIDFEKRMNSILNDTFDSNAKTASIKIKKGAWIGGHSIILKGVTIGENSIVGAGSVITKDIPNNEIWGGNPARFIKKIL